MIDIHPAHHAATTWRDFLIHIATIVLGLLIAVSLEQTVELVHRHREARDARENIRDEVKQNIKITQNDLGYLATMQKELSRDLDVLHSGTPDAQILSQLDYTMRLTRRRDAAWNAAKINGSLALISWDEIESTNYFYETNQDSQSSLVAFFTQMDRAQALLDYAKSTGKLTVFERQQLVALTADALGGDRDIARFFGYELDALQKRGLR
ncbi:MAG TPA: hypothetical protein VGJ21_14720 [Terracidiphilus sp.]|jgi:hypothetical protein